MKKGILASILLGATLFLSGCIFLVAGTVGAVGGYAVTRDTIQGDYDASYAEAWRSAVEVCGAMGTMILKDSNKGAVEALIDRAKVKVAIFQLTPESIRIRVKARKGIFPRIGTAEDVFVRIAQKLMR